MANASNDRHTERKIKNFIALFIDNTAEKNYYLLIVGKNFLGQEYSVATKVKGLKEGSFIGRFFTSATVSLSVLGIVVSLSVIAFTIVFFLSPVNGQSMALTLNANGINEDTVLVSKFQNVRRGDVVIYKYYVPDASVNDNTEYYDEKGVFSYLIKRVIAKGGDELTVIAVPKYASVPKIPPIQNYISHPSYFDYNYSIVLNGEILDESGYLAPAYGYASAINFIRLYIAVVEGRPELVSGDYKGRWDRKDCIRDGVLYVPEGYLFAMGDNRTNSIDCSWVGPQPAENVQGVMIDILYAEEPIAHYLWRQAKYYVLFGWLFGY